MFQSHIVGWAARVSFPGRLHAELDRHQAGFWSKRSHLGAWFHSPAIFLWWDVRGTVVTHTPGFDLFIGSASHDEWLIFAYNPSLIQSASYGLYMLRRRQHSLGTRPSSLA